MKIREICKAIEEIAPLTLQESYDNAGLLVGDANMEAKAALLCIDVTETIIDEAIVKKCNLIVTHHPPIFTGLKSLTGKNGAERCILKAIKNDIAIYAAHTNLDKVKTGVNAKIAEKIGLQDTQMLQPESGKLLKLITFVPKEQANYVREALFEAGAGHAGGGYDHCSYNTDGIGTFRPLKGANPYVGHIGAIHVEAETRIEVILQSHLRSIVLKALLKAHPYEEPAFDFCPSLNECFIIGAGMVGKLEKEKTEKDFLQQLKEIFNIPCIKHSALLDKKIKKVAICGGSGSFLINNAIASQADIFVTGDIKYHDFFMAQDKIVLADIGHFESEQYTKEIFLDIIKKRFPTFVVYFSEVNSNPINYF